MQPTRRVRVGLSIPGFQVLCQCFTRLARIAARPHSESAPTPGPGQQNIRSSLTSRHPAPGRAGSCDGQPPTSKSLLSPRQDRRRARPAFTQPRLARLRTSLHSALEGSGHTPARLLSHSPRPDRGQASPRLAVPGFTRLSSAASSRRHQRCPDFWTRSAPHIPARRHLRTLRRRPRQRRCGCRRRRRTRTSRRRSPRTSRPLTGPQPRAGAPPSGVKRAPTRIPLPRSSPVGPDGGPGGRGRRGRTGQAMILFACPGPARSRLGRLLAADQAGSASGGRLLILVLGLSAPRSHRVVPMLAAGSARRVRR